MHSPKFIDAFLPFSGPIYGRIRRHVFSSKFLAGFAVGLCGCLAIYNATFHHEQPFHFVIRQLVWLAIGALLLFVCSHIPKDIYFKWAFPLAAISLLSLYVLLFLGSTVNGMRGWLAIKTTFWGPVYFQVSEFSKPIFVLVLAKKSIYPINGNRVGVALFARYLAIASLWFAPILLQPNLSLFIIFVITFSVIYWLQKGRVVHLFTTFLVIIPLLVVVIHGKPSIRKTLREYRNLVEEDSSHAFRTSQLKTTLAYGGLWGHHPEQTFWSRSYLPFGYTDAMFATLGESIGFMGVVPIVLGIVCWFFYCIHAARRQEHSSNAIAIVGISMILVTQAFLHISVSVGLLPALGTPLPMFSYGGSSLVSTLASVGIIFSLAEHREKTVEIVDD